MSLRKNITNNSRIVSYSFRSNPILQDKNFIHNFPIHLWLSKLGLPKALANLILFEYWLPDEKKIEVLPAFSYKSITDPMTTTYPLRTPEGKLFFPSAPAGTHERSMATLALEARMYQLRGGWNTNELGTFELLEQNVPSILAELRFPKALNNIVLGYLNYETWKELWYGTSGYTSKSLSYQFPWEDKEKYLNLTNILLVEDQYSLQDKTDVITRGLLLTYIKKLPEALVPIITGYIGIDVENKLKKGAKDLVLDEIVDFLHKYIKMELKTTNSFMNYSIIMLAVKCIGLIRENKGFAPISDQYEYKLLKGITRPGLYIPPFPGFPIKHAFDFLHKFFTDTALSINADFFNMTFFEHVIKHLDHLKPEEIREISRVFYLAKSLIESAYILSMESPPNTLYHFDSEVIRSLCLQVNRMQRGEEIKGLHNIERKPELLNKLSSILNEPLTNIEFNDQKGFLVSFSNKEKGIRFFNYHHRSQILEIMYKFINEEKASPSRRTLFSSAVTYSAQAKDLANRLLDIPLASPKEFLILDEIKQLLNSNTIKNHSYRQALIQVKDELNRGLEDKEQVSVKLRSY